MAPPKIDVERAARLLESYRGPKLGTQLAHEFRRDIHALMEKAYLLRMLDERFEQELERLGVLEVMDRFLQGEVKGRQRLREELDEQEEGSPRLRKELEGQEA